MGTTSLIDKVGFTRAEGYDKVPFGIEDVEKYKRIMADNSWGLSQLLENIDPTDPSRREYNGSDAFQRQLGRFGIRTNSDLLRGIPCGEVGNFYEPNENPNMPRTRDNQSFFTAGDPQSWILFPEFINRQLRVTPLAQDILGEIVAKVTPIDSAGYKTLYLNDTLRQRQLRRVPERGEFPTIYIQTSEHNVSIQKYGVRIASSYEYARRVKLDLFSIYLQRIAAQNKLDQAQQAMDVIINGDGNGNAAPNWNISTLNPSAPAGPGTVYDTYLALYQYANQSSTITKTFDYQTFLKYKATLFPMQMTSIVGRLNELLQILTLQFPNINPLLLLAQFNAEGVKIGSIEMAQDMWRSVRLVYMPFMVGGLIVGMDKNLCLEMLVEVNSNIAEAARNVFDQTNHIIISQNIGFNKIIQESAITASFV